jgi:NADH-quinone oxidoreductase subunit N
MFNFPVPEIDWSVIAPTMIVAITGVFALIIEMVRPKSNNNMIVGVSLIGLLVAAVSIIAQFGYPDASTLGDMVLRDRFSLAFQLLLLVSGFIAILFSEGYLRSKRIPFGEFYPLLLWSIVGAMVMATTKNLLMIFLGLEVLSIALYVMAGMSRSETKSEESALKYFLLGAFASGFLLYGISFIYGATGSLDVSIISAAWHHADAAGQSLLVFGLGLLLVGLCFKSAFAPFHQWTPDVYQGAPTNVTAFMAAGSKIGALAALWRVLEGSSALQAYWMPALFWIAIITMCWGNLAALVQKDVKRVLGYSSIAHAGYILVAILAHFKDPNEVGIGTIVYYLFSYTLMTVGAFAVISVATKRGRESTTFDDLRGLWKRSPFVVGSIIVFMASLIGIPGTSGFVGKLLIFNDALKAHLTPLAIILAVNSIISIAYYLGIAKAMFVDEEPGNEPVVKTVLNPGLAAACILCLAGIFGAFIFYGPLIEALTR